MTGCLASKVVVVTGSGTGIGGGSRAGRLPTAPRWSSAGEAAFITGAALAIDGGSTAR